MTKIKIPPPKPIGVQHIELVLKSMGVKFETEYKFMNPERLYRFDFAIPDSMIAIEYAGLGSNKNAKSGHTTSLGYTSDCDKYNHAACKGWRVIRFTSINYKDAYKFLSILMPDKS